MLVAARAVSFGPIKFRGLITKQPPGRVARIMNTKTTTSTSFRILQLRNNLTPYINPQATEAATGCLNKLTRKLLEGSIFIRLCVFKPCWFFIYIRTGISGINLCTRRYFCT